MIHHIWCSIVTASIVCGCINGRAADVIRAALMGTEKAISVTLQLCSGYLLFCGLMEIAAGLHAERGIRRMLQPLIRLVMPGIRQDKTLDAVGMNLSMNVLGMGNAATPAGLDAMKHMEQEEARDPLVRHDRYMLLILNATSLQLFPTTVLTLRAAAGSANVNAVLLPTMLCTAVSTVTGVCAGILCRKWEERKRGS